MTRCISKKGKTMMKLHFLSVPLLALLVLPHVGGGDSKVPAKQWKLMLTPLEIKPADGTLPQAADRTLQRIDQRNATGHRPEIGGPAAPLVR